MHERAGDLRLHRQNGAPLLANLSARKGFPPPVAQVCRCLRAEALDIWGRFTTITIPFPQDASDETFLDEFLDSCDAMVRHCRLWNIWTAVVWLKGLRIALDHDPTQEATWHTRIRNNLLTAEYRDKVLETKDFDMQKLDGLVKARIETLSQGRQREGFTSAEIRELYYGPMRALSLDTTNWRAPTVPATRFWAVGSCRKDASD